MKGQTLISNDFKDRKNQYDIDSPLLQEPSSNCTIWFGEREQTVNKGLLFRLIREKKRRFTGPPLKRCHFEDCSSDLIYNRVWYHVNHIEAQAS